MSDSNDRQRRLGLGRRGFLKLTGGAIGIGAIGYYLGLRDQPPTDVPRTAYPDYVDGDIGLPAPRGPYLQEAQLAVFQFSADADRLTALCDQVLNAPGNGPIRYVPLMSSIMLMFADMVVSSLDERDQAIGRMSETEAGFWIPTLALRRKGRLYLPDHAAWFVPYLFVDNSHVITTGREVYGFNKQLGQFHKPAHIQIPEFSADVLGVKTFGPEALANFERLLEIRRADPSAAVEPAGAWDSWDKAKTEIDQELLKNMEADPKNRLVEFGGSLVKGDLPIVFLKQFRDVSNTRQACYQAIVEAPIRLQQFHQGGFLSGAYALRVNDLDSHPLAHTLGLRLENGEQRSTLGLWMKVDFVFGEGLEVWKAA